MWAESAEDGWRQDRLRPWSAIVSELEIVIGEDGLPSLVYPGGAASRRWYIQMALWMVGVTSLPQCYMLEWNALIKRVSPAEGARTLCRNQKAVC